MACSLFGLCSRVGWLFSAGAVRPCCRMDWMDLRLKAGIEGGRVHETLSVAIQSVKAIYSGKTTLSDTFWRPGGVCDQISRLHFERVTGRGPDAEELEGQPQHQHGQPSGRERPGSPAAAEGDAGRRRRPLACPWHPARTAIGVWVRCFPEFSRNLGNHETL